MNKVNNGRVDIKSPNTSTLFEMYDKIPANQCVTFRNPTEGLWTDTDLSQLFFLLNKTFKYYKMEYEQEFIIGLIINI